MQHWRSTRTGFGSAMGILLSFGWAVGAAAAPFPSLRRLPPPADDPLIEEQSERSAAPTYPISPVEHRAMVQELQDLLGRVESALARAEVAQVGSTQALQTMGDRLQAARRFLKDLPQAVQTQSPATVRAQWQELRQSLWRDYPRELLTALPEVRAIWLDRSTIVAAGSEAGLRRVFDRMAALGVNTVFLETVNAGYPIYPSRVAPQQNPLTRGWDPLAAAVKLARERNMEIHAWMWVFGVGNVRHNQIVGLPDHYPGPVLAANPQWANLGQNGAVIAAERKTFLDPANPEVRRYLIALMQEMVTQYGVDGVQLDYIRQPRHDPGQEFGYGRASRAKFQQLTGVDPLHLTPNDRSLWWLWGEFRARQIDEFVAEASQALRQTKPKVVISAAVFPWEPLRRFHRLHQVWERWVARGDIDLLVPMTYVPETSRFVRQHVQPVIDGVGTAPVLVLPGVLIRDMPDLELLDQLQAVRDLPSSGYSLFAAEHLRSSFESVLQDNSRSQTDRVVPFRQPLVAARSRFQSLRQEWQSLLSGRSLWLRGALLERFQGKITEIDRLLTQVEQNPTPVNLAQAKRQIDELRNSLDVWLRLESLERPYRLDTWKNRLGAITAMLRYGAAREQRNVRTAQNEPSL
ncbi:MAG: glycoside hydrolase family 10 protein [Pseudanabaenaceae cyanobacterium]